jgi:predicted DNA repair protein MutK
LHRTKDDPVSVGLIALLDDVAALAKVAAASLDDVAAQSAKAGTKALGVVIDDAAVTPRYVVGFAAKRELPIVGQIALGSLKNKLLYLLPGSLALSWLAPWSITPLLMLGGAYLCYEGAEKVLHALRPHAAEHHEDKIGAPPQDLQALEQQRVRSAIQTDFILSAEIMALTLAGLSDQSTVAQAVILAAVGTGVTLLVYGAVALIVKADDVGVSLAVNERPASTLLGLRGGGGMVPQAAGPAPDAASRRAALPAAIPVVEAPAQTPGGADRTLRPVTQALGRGLVVGMPHFLRILALIGTAAMLWVGGGILLHGLEEFGFTAPGHLVHDLAHRAGELLPAVAGAVSWLVTASLSGMLGLAVGALTIPAAGYVLAPLAGAVMGMFRRKKVA